MKWLRHVLMFVASIIAALGVLWLVVIGGLMAAYWFTGIKC